MAIANYEDRFVIPTAHRETGEDAYRHARLAAASASATAAPAARASFNLFGTTRKRAKTPDGGGVMATHLPRALGAAVLSDRRTCRRRLPRSPPCSTARRLSPAQRAPARRAAAPSSPAAISTTCRSATSCCSTARRALSLHLFEHVHGESRDRGQAMVDLLALYEKSGLQVDGERTAGLPAAVPRISLPAAAPGGAADCWPARPHSCGDWPSG